MIAADAHAKINLGLAVGPLRDDGLHEVATVLQRLDLCDRVCLEPAEALRVEGFPDDTLVRRALEALARAAGVQPRWRALIDKQIPVAAGLGGGSSDAATALLLGNALLEAPLEPGRLHSLARELGSDVPFFLTPGPKLATGDGTTLEPLTLPQDFAVVLLLPDGESKESTAGVYARYAGEAGFAVRRERLRGLLAAGAAAELAALPGNDLVQSPHAAALRSPGAFRAEVSGAGPCLNGLFARRELAAAARAALEPLGQAWLAAPAW
jgi:4-diphosphocytidyl-2-C-methyl-D-erythritol kinase